MVPQTRAFVSRAAALKSSTFLAGAPLAAPARPLTRCLHASVQTMAAAALHNPTAVTQKVFFDITIGQEPAGRITIGLYAKDVPKVRAHVRSSLATVQALLTDVGADCRELQGAVHR